MKTLRWYSPDQSPMQPSVSRALLLFILLLAATSSCVAHAAVALLLEQPYGKLNLVDPAGHSAIYLDHVCAATPLQLRPCEPGELGVVLSRYDGIGDHDWVAMPLLPYLYSVTDAADIPLTVNRATETALRDNYRRRYLRSIAPDTSLGQAPAGNWYQLLGSAFDRTIYGFRVNTTPEQDAKLIATFNDRRNIEAYNGAFRNCADFARVTLNRFYPHAVRRNYIADLGITTPKSVARSLAHYAAKHPGTGFGVFVIPQVKGSLPRSHANVDVAEGILKRYSIPLTVISPVSTAVVVAAYIGHGRFSMPKNPPLLDVNEPRAMDEPLRIERPFPPMPPAIPAPEVAMVSIRGANGGQGTKPAVAIASASGQGFLTHPPRPQSASALIQVDSPR